MTLDDTKLFKWLRKKDAQLASKALEVRERVTRWLTYVPAMFPHYTSHTIDHSEEIVTQISNVVFDAKTNALTARQLTPIEAYVIISAAMLHDAGMVVSPSEQEALLETAEWHTFIASGSHRTQYEEALRVASDGKKNGLGVLVGYRILRLLVSEFIRLRHPERGATFVLDHDTALHHVSLGDHRLGEIIANVCAGHGLRSKELADDERFPLQADIRGEHVNVRFCAMLLRIGDLLDLRTDRACPLLLSASSPLPSDSMSHWTQYKAYKRISITHNQIEIIAQCTQAHEDRIIREWCDWIVQEIQSATTLLDPRSRHGEWRPPQTIIRVGPAKGAQYHPVQWKFELDNETLFDRLVRDAYSEELVFIRELIQNALDATRCAMYLDHKEIGLPANPSCVDAAIRSRYKIRVSLHEVSTPGCEPGSEVVVEDDGIGMTEQLIKDNLLQIGKSFYRSDEFKRTYPFFPTSRFGIGFLTVFAESSDVTLETKHQNGNDALVLRMTGPRNYLLVERGVRTRRGTRVAVRLADTIDATKFVDLIRRWCTRVEFAIDVTCDKSTYEIRRESPLDFVSHVFDNRTKTRFEIHALPVISESIEGEVYCMSAVHNGVRRWFANREFAAALKRNPALGTIAVPASMRALHGISLHARHGFADHGRSMSYRVDVRGSERVDLSRQRVEMRREPIDLIAEHLRKHLSERKWEASYLQRLASHLERLPEIMDLKFISVPYRSGTRLRSPAELAAEPQLILATPTVTARGKRLFKKPPRGVPSAPHTEGIFRGSDWWARYWKQREIISLFEDDEGYLVLLLGEYLQERKDMETSVCRLGHEGLIGVDLSYDITLGKRRIANADSVVLRWIRGKAGRLDNGDLQDPLVMRFLGLYSDGYRHGANRTRFISELHDFAARLAQNRQEVLPPAVAESIAEEERPPVKFAPLRSLQRHLKELGIES